MAEFLSEEPVIVFVALAVMVMLTIFNYPFMVNGSLVHINDGAATAILECLEIPITHKRNRYFDFVLDAWKKDQKPTPEEKIANLIRPDKQFSKLVEGVEIFVSNITNTSRRNIKARLFLVEGGVATTVFPPSHGLNLDPLNAEGSFVRETIRQSSYACIFDVSKLSDYKYTPCSPAEKKGSVFAYPFVCSQFDEVRLVLYVWVAKENAFNNGNAHFFNLQMFPFNDRFLLEYGIHLAKEL